MTGRAPAKQKTAGVLEAFDRLADYPSAVAKVRELVITLAVQGKLVPQDPKDEPANDLLARLSRDLSAEKRDRQAAPLPPIPEDDYQYDLPRGWSWVRFRDVAIIASNLVKPNDYLDLTHVAPDNIQKGTGVLLPCSTVRDDKVISSNHRFFPGQIVYSKIRPNLSKVVLVDFDGLCSADMYPIDALVDARFLQRYMLSQSFLVQAVKTDTRVAMPKINQNELNALAVPVPPLAEQKRIVAKVDELMVLCDRLEAQLQERDTRQAALARAALARFADAPTPTNLELLFHDSFTITPADVRKTILTLAFRGRLVPQDPREEDALAALTRIGIAPSLDNEGDASSNYLPLPPSWTRVRFEDIAVIAGGVTLGRKLTGRKTISLPYLRVANVKRGEVDLNDVKDVTIAEDEVERYALRPNDLLMTEGGDWDKVGRAAIWKGEIAPCLHQNHIFRARMKSPELLPRWLVEYFNSPNGRSYFESAAKQTTNLASINMRQVRACPIPIAPLAEQRRIVAKVDQLMALVERWEAQIAAVHTTSDNLLSALVAQLASRPHSATDAP
jgi:type I restriction enzyme S subunit